MTNLSGEQGHGKSSIMYDIIARLTRGTKFPDGEDAPLCKALILSCEDNPEDSAGPKLMAAGADISKVLKWPTTFDLAQLEQLERQLVADPEIKLVMIEPLYEQVAGDMNKDTKSVGKSLEAIQKMANRCNVAVVGVHHFGKAKADNANQKTIGSMAFTGKPRACWGVVPKKDDPEIKIFAPGKRNVRLTTSALQFRIIDATIQNPVTDETIETAKVVWLDEQLNMSLDDLLRQSNGGKDMQSAKEWVADYLADGPRESEQMKKDALAAGYTFKQLRTAREKLGVKGTKKGMEDGWICELPTVHGKDSGDWTDNL